MPARIESKSFAAAYIQIWGQMPIAWQPINDPFKGGRITLPPKVRARLLERAPGVPLWLSGQKEVIRVSYGWDPSSRSYLSKVRRGLQEFDTLSGEGPHPRTRQDKALKKRADEESGTLQMRLDRAKNAIRALERAENEENRVRFLPHGKRDRYTGLEKRLEILKVYQMVDPRRQLALRLYMTHQPLDDWHALRLFFDEGIRRLFGIDPETGLIDLGVAILMTWGL